LETTYLGIYFTDFHQIFTKWWTSNRIA